MAAGADVDFLNVAQDGFDLLAEIKKKEKPSTKAVVLNLPHNPTGCVLSPILLDWVRAGTQRL